MLELVLLTICTAQAPELSPPIDRFFGGMKMGVAHVDALWGYTLIDACLMTNPLSTWLLPKVAWPAASDLFRRMDRPITTKIGLDTKLTPFNDPKDDLAAGIALWTLQWKANYMWLPGESIYHEKAEYFLSRAQYEGDPVQQSFASLAYAYCAVRGLDDENVNRSEKITFGSHRQRMKTFRTRLSEAVIRFEKTVPERALRAELALLNITKNAREAEAIILKIRVDFAQLKGWDSFGLIPRPADVETIRPGVEKDHLVKKVVRHRQICSFRR